jgi:hypothetical protein
MRGFPACLLFVVLVTPILAQDSPPDTGAGATERASRLSPLKAASLEVPGAVSAWAVRVIRTGGVAGQSVDIAISSQGALKCSSAENKCPKEISAKDLQDLAALVDPRMLRNSKSSLSDLCKDCFVTRVTVGHRDEKGKVQTYFAYFDDVTAAKAPFQMVRIATSLLNR